MDKMLYTHKVVKRNKRLCILRVETDEIVYTPPDFLRPKIRNRGSIQKLADRLCHEWDNPIKAIMEFEANP